MTCIFRIIKRYWSSWGSHGSLQRVSFTPSTIVTDRERILRNIASPTPFQNFLNEMRLTSLQDMGKAKMPLRESLKMRKSAVRLWSSLSEKKKKKYRVLADNWQFTRLPMQYIEKSTTHLGTQLTNNPEVLESTDASVTIVASRKSRRSSRSMPVKRKTRSKSVTKRRKVKKPSEIIAPPELPKTPRRKRRMNAAERRSSEIFANLSNCVSRIDLPEMPKVPETEEMQELEVQELEVQEENQPDLSTHRHTKRKRLNNQVHS
ncbi:uncharacterized protein LOC117790294 [Drosophila innubila]|uniref:uncharacterized protein LOC117790294 n=1 Tax=Drosophila innubila TaxID=198719 RepID=UPI00148D95E7|nr:uncharacterized protein LOC117790294 [Drosophila innubila]